MPPFAQKIEAMSNPTILDHEVGIKIFFNFVVIDFPSQPEKIRFLMSLTLKAQSGVIYDT